MANNQLTILALALVLIPLASGYAPPTGHAHFAAGKIIEAAVEGMVYCQKCEKYGSWSLAGAEPLPSARVSVICKSHKDQVNYYRVYQTDSNGHFYAQLKGFKLGYHFLDHPLHACKVKLVSSPREDCSLFSNINNALNGAPLRYEDKKVKWTNYEAVVYAAGPLAFRPNHCPATPAASSYP